MDIHSYPTTHASAHESALQSCSVKELKAALASRNIDTSTFKDKDELVQVCLDNNVQIGAQAASAPAPALGPAPAPAPPKANTAAAATSAATTPSSAGNIQKNAAAVAATLGSAIECTERVHDSEAHTYPTSHASAHDNVLATHKVSELKALLASHNIDFSGCMDKDEFVRLAIENNLGEKDLTT